jgi:hypothetical protein
MTIVVIFVLIYLSTKSLVKTAIVSSAVPFSLIGAFWLLYLLDYNMSIGVWVGLIALAGLDAETGVVMLLYLDLAQTLERKGADAYPGRSDAGDALRRGAAHPAQADDGHYHYCRSDADHVEQRHRFRRDEAHRRADDRRNGHLAAAGAAGLPGDFLPVAGPGPGENRAANQRTGHRRTGFT